MSWWKRYTDDYYEDPHETSVGFDYSGKKKNKRKGWGSWGWGSSIWGETSIFKKIEKKEIVEPEMSWYEKSDYDKLFNTIIDRRMTKEYNYSKPSAWTKLYKEIAKKMPDYLHYNMRNMYRHRPHIRKMKNTDGKNQWQTDLLEKTDDYYMKGITYDSDMNSGLMASHIMANIVEKITDKKFDPKDEDNQTPEEDEILKMLGMPEGGGEGEGEGQEQEGENQQQESGKGKGSTQGKLSKEMQSIIKQAVQEAGNQTKQMMDLVETLEESFSDAIDGNEEMGEKGQSDPDALGGVDSNKGSIQNALELLQLEQNIDFGNFSRSDINNFVSTMKDKAVSYFSSHFTTHKEEIFESDEITDIINPEYLLPIFGNAFLEEMQTSHKKYFMKFNVYLDSSGSMDSPVRLEHGGEITAITLGKIFGARLMKWKMHKDLYHFDGSVGNKLKKKEFIQIFKRGGTSLDRVVQHIEEHGEPSIVITDCQSSLHQYNENVYFVTLNRGRINHDQYYANKQVAAFEHGKISIPTDKNHHYAIISCVM